MAAHPAFGLVEHPHEQVGEQHGVGSERWLLKLDDAVAGRVLEGPQRSGEEVADGFPLGNVQARIGEWTVLRVQVGVIGRLVVDEFRTARLRLHSFLVWREAHHPGAPATAALLEEFYAADIWEYTLPAYRINRQLLADNLRTPGTPFAEP